MQSQFIKEFVNDIYLFYNNNVIVIRKNRYVKKSFNIFVKHISLLFLVIFLIKKKFESKEELLIYFISTLFISYSSSISKLYKRALFKIFLFVSI